MCIKIFYKFIVGFVNRHNDDDDEEEIEEEIADQKINEHNLNGIHKLNEK